MRYSPERSLEDRLAKYMQDTYPRIMYRFDLAASLKLTIRQASRHKRLHPRRGYPDLIILAIRDGEAGLFVELKAPNTRLKKRNGEWASEHIAEQAAMHERLRQAGYRAEFACGEDESIKLIDDYLAANRDR